jgi:hypothetical protein
MLFRKKLQRSCSYCSFGTELTDGTVLCAKKGIVDPNQSCLKFRYDPTRRVPMKQKAPDFSKYDEDDFSL